MSTFRSVVNDSNRRKCFCRSTRVIYGILRGIIFKITDIRSVELSELETWLLSVISRMLAKDFVCSKSIQKE